MKRYLYVVGVLSLVWFSGCTPSVLKTGKNLETAREVVAEGKVNMKDMDGDTSLHYAAGEGNLEVTKYLVEHGANIEAANKWGNTPILAAVIGRKLETSRYLVEQGVNIHVTNEWGITPLISAASRGELEIIKLLIANGADIEAKSDKGNTALMWASRSGHVNAVRYLVDMGADKSALNKKKQSAYSIAQEIDRADIMSLTNTVSTTSDEAVKRAFSKAKAENSISAYEHFQAFYPNNPPYTQEAARLAQQLRMSRKDETLDKKQKLDKIKQLLDKGDLEAILEYTDSLR